MAIYFKHNDTEFGVGDTVNVHLRIVEDQKTRIQLFTGLIISIKGRGDGKSFTVRKIGANNIGVEKIFPVLTPQIDKIELKSKGKVRRAKLYYLRDRVGRRALRVKEDLSANRKEKSSKTRTKSRGASKTVSS